MATDNRATGDQKQTRRGKSPVITLEVTEIAATTTEQTASTVEGTEPAAGLEVAEASPSDTIPGPPEPAVPDSAPTDEPSEAASGRAQASDGDHGPASSVEQSEPALDRVAEPARTPEPPAAGFGRLVAAGLIGALLTGGLAIGAQVAGIVPGANPPVTPDIQSRLAAMDQALKDVAARPLPASAGANIAPDLAPLRQQMESAVASLERRLKALEDRPAPAVSTGSGAPAPAVDLEPLNREITALKAAMTALNQPRPPTPTAAIDPALVDQRIRAAIQPQTDRIGVLDGRLQGTNADLKALADNLQALGAKIAVLDAARGQGDALGQKAALVVGLQLLRSAADRGGPYGAELAAAKALGADTTALQPLEAAAATGLATRDALAMRFATLAPAIQRAGTPAPEGGVIDRLTASAQSLVRVRPVGETSGDDVGAVVGRVQAKLARHDLAGAIADADRLPAAAKALAQGWLTEAGARLAADTALQRTTAQALTALGTR